MKEILAKERTDRIFLRGALFKKKLGQIPIANALFKYIRKTDARRVFKHGVNYHLYELNCDFYE